MRWLRCVGWRIQSVAYVFGDQIMHGASLLGSPNCDGTDQIVGRSIVVFIDLAYQRAGSIVNDASDLIGRCFVVRLSGVSIVDENEQRSIFFSKKGVYLQGSHTQERKVPDARVDDMDSYVQAHVSHPREL